MSDPHYCAHFISSMRGLSSNKFDKWKKILTDDPRVPGSCSPKIDHQTVPDPNVLHCLIDPNLPPDEKQQCEKEIAKSVICNNYVSTNKLIDHILKETDDINIFQNTAHQSYWLVYHNALSFFVAKESYAYMKYKGY